MYKHALFLFVLVLYTNYIVGQKVITSFDDTPQSLKPNYSNLNNWCAHPDKEDKSDLIPRPLRKETNDLSGQVDVFFIHPTMYLDDPKNEFLWNADIDDKKMNKKVDNKPIKYQASIFNLAGRLYAPRYRQAHIRSFYRNYKSDGKKALILAYQDVRSAFIHYLKNYNNGRPFILAGHSQGALHLISLLKEMIDGKDLQKKLIAAYVIGWGVKKNEFKTIPLGNSPDQTGCYLTWRTYSRGYLPSYLDTNDVCVNPINWKSNNSYASYKENKGSILFGFNVVRKHLFDAQVNGSVLWVGKPNLFLGGLFERENYHIGDLNLFYLSVRRNAVLRAKKYLTEN